MPAGGIVFTTIQKFAPPKEGPIPVLSERQNIVVMADEAHRSQYADLAENITVALPNAVRIGFTGTPVEKADRSTRLVFGDYVSVYRMRQAQEDQATVPIYYESRQIPIEVDDPEQLEQVEEVLEAEEDEAASEAPVPRGRSSRKSSAPPTDSKRSPTTYRSISPLAARCWTERRWWSPTAAASAAEHDRAAGASGWGSRPLRA